MTESFTKPAISISGLSKRYRLGSLGVKSLREEFETFFQRGLTKKAQANDFWALRNVSFELPEGSATGIVGRNGAGKSTLLKILSKITEPTAGEIRIRGRVGSLLEVGTGFHPELSGRDNIYLNGAMLGMRRREVQAKFDAIVEFSEVAEFLDTPVKRYSSGMYVKLGFAIAAHLEPEILIVDEVLAVGDAAFQRKCIDKMQEICQSRGRTILFVSHAMATIRRLCKQCVLLEKGQAFGPMPTEEAIERYSSNGTMSETSVNVSELPRGWGSDGEVCRMLSIRVGGSGRLRFNAPLDVEIELQSTQALSKAMVGLAFHTIEGQRILTLDSDGSGKTFALREGRSLIRLHLDKLPLHPGRFYLNAVIGDGRTFYDMLDTFALWEVDTSAEDYESDRSFGGCRLTPALTVETIGV